MVQVYAGTDGIFQKQAAQIVATVQTASTSASTRKTSSVASGLSRTTFQQSSTSIALSGFPETSVHSSDPSEVTDTNGKTVNPVISQSSQGLATDSKSVSATWNQTPKENPTTTNIIPGKLITTRSLSTSSDFASKSTQEKSPTTVIGISISALAVVLLVIVAIWFRRRPTANIGYRNELHDPTTFTFENPVFSTPLAPSHNVPSPTLEFNTFSESSVLADSSEINTSV